MKKITKIFLIALASAYMISCQNDEHLVTYPESFPVFDQAEVDESIITYGDSITVSVGISDKGTPLSTLEIQVVLNNELLTSESIRTKGNSAEVTRRYGVPFVANRPDNASVKVYLSSINVDGYTTDTILRTTTAMRPEIKELWIVPTVGKTYRLSLADTANLVYFGNGMTYGPTVTYRIATKLDKFSKVDWSGLVFGKVGDGIGVIDQSGDPITDSDPTLVGISEITFDALKFTSHVGGKLLEPVTTLDINTELTPVVMAGKDFLEGNIYFGEGVEVTFTGLADLQKSLPPDYFEITGANTATFQGKNAIYKAYYYKDGEYLYVEPQPDVIFPDALWICGTGFGRPSAPYEVTSSWNWNSPFDYAPAMLVSDGVYQVTIYGLNTDGGFGFGTLDFKFFYKRGWWDAAHEIDAADYAVTAPFFGRTDVGNTGNINAGTAPLEGIFKVTLDMNAKTINIETISL